MNTNSSILPQKAIAAVIVGDLKLCNEVRFLISFSLLKHGMTNAHYILGIYELWYKQLINYNLDYIFVWRVYYFKCYFYVCQTSV